MPGQTHKRHRRIDRPAPVSNEEYEGRWIEADASLMGRTEVEGGRAERVIWSIRCTQRRERRSAPVNGFSDQSITQHINRKKAMNELRQLGPTPPERAVSDCHSVHTTQRHLLLRAVWRIENESGANEKVPASSESASPESSILHYLVAVRSTRHEPCRVDQNEAFSRLALSPIAPVRLHLRPGEARGSSARRREKNPSRGTRREDEGFFLKQRQPFEGFNFCPLSTDVVCVPPTPTQSDVEAKVAAIEI